MTKTLAKTMMFGSSLLILSACSTMTPNPLISDAQTRLSAAYNNKETAERGQGDLANAKIALARAQTEWANGDKERADHQLMMGQTYLDLAETRGKQSKVEQENIRLSALTQVSGMKQQMANKDQMLADKNAQIAGQNTQLANKDRQLADAQAQLSEYNMTVTDLGSTMVLQDVSFETGKSVLLSGGVNRLQPLINYLRLSPDTRVRIEGYTDSVGAAAYNQQLSLNRANSVRSILVNNGINAERITTIGSGLTKPLATNATAAGRQSNRRVEITLLKQPGV